QSKPNIIDKVILEYSNMVPSNTPSEVTSLPEAGMAPDGTGCLYDTRARPLFDHLAGPAGARRLEVFPALRWCAYRIQRFMQAEAARQGLADGAAPVLVQRKHGGVEPVGCVADGLEVRPE